MKCAVEIYIGFIVISLVNGHLANLTKFDDVTTANLPIENNTRAELVKDTKHSNFSKSVKTDEGRVYLEDVLYIIKNQNWTEDEQECYNQTLNLLHGLQNFTLWAVWDWDSVASQPQGLLFGNRYQLGNFDECMRAPWTASHPELRTQYCLTDIELQRTDNDVKKKIGPVEPYQSALDYIQNHKDYSRPLNQLTWGVCVPSSCPPKSVERLMAIMLARSHLGSAGLKAKISISEKCQKAGEHVSFDGLFYGFVAMISILTSATIVCTYLNKRNIMDSANTTGSAIIKAFCLKQNSLELLRMRKEGVEVLYGIRFLTICLIVLDHQLGIFNSGPVSNGLVADQDAQSLLGMFILHDDLFVDSFFLLSGFLSASSLSKFKKFPNPILIIFRRYVRIIVAFAVILFYVCAVFPHTGSGPLWPKVIAGETDLCKKNWWLSILMLNNYVDSENICLIVSWYIPCDFHYFVVVVLLFWVYKKYKTPAVWAAVIVGIISLVLPGIINYTNNLAAIQLFTYEFVTNPRASSQFQITYIKSHTRMAAYIVGCISGFIFSYFAATGNIKRITTKWAVFGTITGLIIMLLTMLTGSTFLWREYGQLEGALYAALNRPVWAGGLALLVLCCSLGHVPLIKQFLSWYAWVPLGRLSYGLYLTHSVIITRNVYVTRNPDHNDYPGLLVAAAGVIMVGCLASYVIWLIAEAPVNNLVGLCFKPRKPKKPQSFVKEGDQTNNNGEKNQGYLQDNLPESICVISSKV